MYETPHFVLIFILPSVGFRIDIVHLILPYLVNVSQIFTFAVCCDFGLLPCFTCFSLFSVLYVFYSIKSKDNTFLHLKIGANIAYMINTMVIIILLLLCSTKVKINSIKHYFVRFE